MRVSAGLDFLDVLGPDGKVVLRTSSPYQTGDYRNQRPEVAAALKGQIATCRALFSGRELEQEADGLAERAFIQIEETPFARLSEKKAENRGMGMVSAVPIVKGTAVIGVVYGGILVNRNQKLIDQIHEVIYKHDTYNGAPVGTATIFLGDCRIATTVRLANGNRAIGTRLSKPVADRVLDNGEPWVDEAFVVKDWYLTAYEPIRGIDGEIIGILYTGILKQPFVDIERNMLTRYVLLSLFGLLVALVVAFIMANRLARPIRQLVEAADNMSRGIKTPPIAAKSVCQETSQLVEAFNHMTQALADREESLRGLNRNYMETLGFVSHELKSPLASIMNYSFLLREHKLGPLTEKQEKAAVVIDNNVNRLVEMARHYLNLSRIENNTLDPVMARTLVLEDILQSVVETVQIDAETQNMKIDNRVGAGLAIQADANMIREVFENLLTNAVKYGRTGGTIRIAAVEADAWLKFSVRNDGQGIAADQLPRVFEKFYRGSGGDVARAQRGTGLGMFITKSIVEAHGGRIEARSELGQWAEFEFTLPRSRPELSADVASVGRQG
jgi:signal transduction histidine kinase